MSITRLIVENFKGLARTELEFQPGLNILVGDNETGKSTVLEAINLALTKQLNRRDAGYELHSFLFHHPSVENFIGRVRKGETLPPLRILIEVYLADDPALAEHVGTNNSRNENCAGVRFAIEFDDRFAEEYQAYIADKEKLTTIPTEFYRIDWRNFADEPLSARTKPIQPGLIDPSALTNSYAANRYVLELARDFLTGKQKVDLALAYRQLREVFQSDSGVAKINELLASKRGTVSDRELSVALDMTARSTWETSVSPHLDGIPLVLVGKGEQTAIKIKLALEASEACEVVLIEEPETHLAHGNLNRLINHVSERVGDKQLIINTHSSFVLNKLGIDATVMFDGKRGVRLSNLPDDTRRYFMKLPGHDTLRMVLAERSILVEGPSDELIVQKAYHQQHGRLPLEDEVEVISVNGLAFKRFLDIAMLLDLDVSVVTDNDGDPERVTVKYEEYLEKENIKIHFSDDDSLPTLEPQLVAANGRELLNKILEKSFNTEDDLIDHMINNKADTALKLFESPKALRVPEYIAHAIR